MDKLIPLLEEIRDNQRKQIEMSEEAFQFTKDNIHRTENIQKNAEALQASIKKVLFRVIFPVIFILTAYLSWILFTRL